MRRKLRIYLPFVNAGMQETATYRTNWIFMMLGNVLGCFISYFLWKAIFLSGDNASMNGFNMPQMVVYIFLIFLTATMINSGGTYDIGEEIRDGSIAMRLIKPVSYNGTFLFQELGNKLMTVCILIVPLVAGVEIVRFRLMGEVQFEVIRFFLYMLSAAFAYLINFFFNICFGFIAFFVRPDYSHCFYAFRGRKNFIDIAILIFKLHAGNDLYGNVQRKNTIVLYGIANDMGIVFLVPFQDFVVSFH